MTAAQVAPTKSTPTMAVSHRRNRGVTSTAPIASAVTAVTVPDG